MGYQLMTTIIEHNVETGNVIERDMTTAEKAVYDKTILDMQAQAEANKTAKENAEAKLAALGLTGDDLRALGL